MFRGVALAILLAAPDSVVGADDGPGPFAGRLSLGTAPEYSSGSYGGDRDTNIVYVPFSTRYRLDDFALTPWRDDTLSLKLTVPFIHIDGPGAVVGGAGGPIDTGGRGRGAGSGSGSGGMMSASTASDTEEGGLGDVAIQLAYQVPTVPTERDGRFPWLTVLGRVKLPTASESKGLGTGEPDFTLYAELDQLFGPIGLFFGGGYVFMGNPDDYDLSDRWLASGGFDVELTSTLSLGLGYDYREAAASHASDAHEISPWLGVRIGDGFRFEPYAVFGVSDGSPDYGFGMRLAWSVLLGRGDGNDERPAPPDEALRRTDP